MTMAILLFSSFLLGSIPFGWIIGKIKGIDLRKMGSGNIGATNVLRALGWKLALPVFILDTGKGSLPVLFVKSLNFANQFVVLVGILVILGHSFSPWLKFKGGKGVATGLGVMFGIVPQIALIAFLIWGLVLVITRYVSLASTFAVISIPILMFLFDEPLVYFYFGLLVTALVVLRHIPNYRRLAVGTESKIDQKKNKKGGKLNGDLCFSHPPPE